MSCTSHLCRWRDVTVMRSLLVFPLSSCSKQLRRLMRGGAGDGESGPLQSPNISQHLVTFRFFQTLLRWTTEVTTSNELFRWSLASHDILYTTQGCLKWAYFHVAKLRQIASFQQKESFLCGKYSRYRFKTITIVFTILPAVIQTEFHLYLASVEAFFGYYLFFRWPALLVK